MPVAVTIAAAPTLPEVWPDILQALAGRALIVTYNVEFDAGILKQDAARYHLELPQIEWECLLPFFAQKSEQEHTVACESRIGSDLLHFILVNWGKKVEPASGYGKRAGQTWLLEERSLTISHYDSPFCSEASHSLKMLGIPISLYGDR